MHICFEWELFEGGIYFIQLGPDNQCGNNSRAGGKNSRKYSTSSLANVLYRSLHVYISIFIANFCTVCAKVICMLALTEIPYSSIARDNMFFDVN